MPGERETPLRAIHVQHKAHDAGITCIAVAKDADSSTWFVGAAVNLAVKNTPYFS